MHPTENVNTCSPMREKNIGEMSQEIKEKLGMTCGRLAQLQNALRFGPPHGEGNAPACAPTVSNNLQESLALLDSVADMLGCLERSVGIPSCADMPVPKQMECAPAGPDRFGHGRLMGR